jgi:hypothetical protein
VRARTKSAWLGALLAAAAGAAAAEEPRWWTVTGPDGAALGWASEAVTERADGREVVDVQEFRLVEQGSAAAKVQATTLRREDAAGRTVAIVSLIRIGDSETRTRAAISGDRAEVERVTPAERRTVTVALPGGVRFDDGEPLLAAWDRSATPSIEFSRFDLDALAVERVVVQAAPEGWAVRRRYDGDQLIGVSRLKLDGQGRVVEAVQPMFGTSIAIRAADEATALKPHAAYRLLPATMSKSPFRISDPQAGRHIRYRFGFRDGLDFALPETGEQRAAAAEPGAVVDVCSDCGPGLPTDPAYLADALKPTPWLQSDDARLKALAAPVTRMKVSDARKMALLLEAARPYLAHIDFTGHYSALETLKRRSGDCTEAAVLLAALGRAAGIPTKVANGVVYSRERYHGVGDAFLPHSWTLAYVDGRWKSFDLALDAFDSTHLALTVGDGDARSVSAAGQLAGLLVWNEMAEVRTRPNP